MTTICVLFFHEIKFKKKMFFFENKTASSFFSKSRQFTEKDKMKLRERKHEFKFASCRDARDAHVQNIKSYHARKMRRSIIS